MRLLITALLAQIILPLSTKGQSTNNVALLAQSRTYMLQREDEDWSFLRDRNLRADFWDPIKYVPLRKGADGWYMTTGAEARGTWEQIGNDNWGQSHFTNGYLNQRYMPYLDLHLGGHFRSFIELKSGLNSFRTGTPRPIDEKKLDFQSGFFEVGSSGTKAIALRVGRHEMQYGSGRLIVVREGPNVRLSFDGFVLKSQAASWKVDGFAVRPDQDNPGFFDNAPKHDVGFWGVYATNTTHHKDALDLYYLGLDRKQATFERGTAHELRHSLGVRFSRPIATETPGWDVDDEALWQFGTFGSNKIEAWTVATETGYRLPNYPLKPRFSLRADIASGDHPHSNTLGTFNPLFPTGNYFGVIATTGPGPVNFFDVHPRIDTTLDKKISLYVDWFVQWRQTLEDGIYSQPGTLIRAADGSRSRFVGHRPGMELHWQENRHLWFQADYGMFYAGGYLKESQPGRNLNYWALWSGYKF